MREGAADAASVLEGHAVEVEVLFETSGEEVIELASDLESGGGRELGLPVLGEEERRCWEDEGSDVGEEEVEVRVGREDGGGFEEETLHYGSRVGVRLWDAGREGPDESLREVSSARRAEAKSLPSVLKAQTQDRER